MQLELGLTWGTVVVYTLVSVLGWLGLVWRSERLLRWVAPALAAGLAAHSAAIVLRWVRVGHGPYISSSEVLSSSVWVGVVILAVLAWREPKARIAAGPALGVSILLLAWGLLASADPEPLPPTFEGIWLVIHIAFAKVAYGSIVVAAGVAVAYLLRARGGAEADVLGRLDQLAARLVTLGFIAVGFMIAAGALWAQNAWGRYWSWDPIETWAAATWVAYGLFLHLRLAWKVRGTLSAWMVLALLGASILAFFLVPKLLPTVHTEFMVD